MGYILSVIAERWGTRPRHLSIDDDDVRAEIKIIEIEGFERWWRREQRQRREYRRWT